MTVFTNIWHLTRVLSTCLLEALSWKITFHNLMLGKWGWKTVACPTIKYFQSIDRTLYPTHGTGENIYYLKLAIVFQAQLAFKKKNKLYGPFFYGWGSTASRLQPLRGGSLLFTIQFPEICGNTHFIDLSEGWVESTLEPPSGFSMGPLDWESKTLTTRLLLQFVRIQQ